MNKTLQTKKEQTNLDNIHLQDKKLVNTATLMNLLDCGKATAIYIGNMANAKIQAGRRILWNTKLIQQYIDDIAE